MYGENLRTASFPETEMGGWMDRWMDLRMYVSMYVPFPDDVMLAGA
jgi:hypothetical protein